MCDAAMDVLTTRRSQKTHPPEVRKSKPDSKSVIRRTFSTIIDNLSIDFQFMNELKTRRVINDHILADVMGRANRPARVLRLMEQLLNLGPHALRETCAVMAKCGHKDLAMFLTRELTQERDRAWRQSVTKPLSRQTIVLDSKPSLNVRI